MLTSRNAVARVAGVLYAIGSIGLVIGMVVRSRVIEAGDPAATAANYRASESLIRVATTLGVVSVAAWVLTVVALFQLLHHVNRPLAAIMGVFVVLALAAEILSLIAQHTALSVAIGVGPAAGSSAAGSTAFVMLMAETARSATLVAGHFWGLWLLPLGYLVMRSEAFPGVLGALLVLGGFSLLGNAFLGVLTGRSVALLLVLDLGELLFVVWLIVKGAEVSRTDSPVTIATSSQGGTR